MEKKRLKTQNKLDNSRPINTVYYPYRQLAYSKESIKQRSESNKWQKERLKKRAKFIKDNPSVKEFLGDLFCK